MTDARKNDQAYPHVQRVADPAAQDALRFAFDGLNKVRQQVKGPTRGTLNPDQKPTNLGKPDTGVLFYSTDFDRTYQWNGSRWVDAPNSPPRNHVAYFLTSPDPPTGWLPCDGSNGTASTGDARTVFFKTPSITQLQGQVAWVRV